MNWISISSAFWLGILTAISPCPMATNIAAISFIGRKIGSRWAVLFSGLLYTAGRSIVYIILGAGIMAGLMATGEISRFLQKYINEILGPIMILVGMSLLGMIASGRGLNLASEKIQKKAASGGVLFAFPLGAVFALSFCPISAGLFFGALIPLSVKSSSKFILPLLFGFGTALPVVFFAFIMAFGGEIVGRAFKRLTQIEVWIRNATGILFIVTGIYYSLAYIFEIL